MPVKIIFGTAGITVLTTDAVQEELQILRKHGVKDLDTASIYTGSEALIGKLGAAKSFVLHTKAPGFTPGCLSRGSMLSAMKSSLGALNLASVETYFLHSPDPMTPLEEALAAAQELYEEGKFRRFGLSNFNVSDVELIHRLATEKGSVVPTVFQGNYNPLSRHYEQELFPLLRKLKIAFWAYSPLAGGFLVKSSQAIAEGNKGRWNQNSTVGHQYHGLYSKPTLISALEKWESIAKGIGITKASLAYRWVSYHSALKADLNDCVIIGASSPTQLRQTLEGLDEGPLPAKVLPDIEDIWEIVRTEAPVDNYHG